MMWKPNCDFTRSLIWPGLQREGRLLELRHHPAAAEVVEVAAVGLRALVLGDLLRQRREVGAALHLLEDLLGLLPDVRFVLAVGLQQDVAGADLLRRLVLLDVVVVVALDVGRRDDDLLPRLIAIEQQVSDLALLADAVLGLVRRRSARRRRRRSR